MEVKNAVWNKIVTQYNGNTLFLDFWGMGCGLCRSGMLSLRKLVEEMKNELAMCGAYWYDEDTKFFRFCGDDILTEDMTSDLLKDVKEYYIIGMKVHK